MQSSTMSLKEKNYLMRQPIACLERSGGRIYKDIINYIKALPVKDAK